MKSLRCCLILILLGVSSSAALANTIPDPKVGFGPVGSNFGPYTQTECLLGDSPPNPACFFTIATTSDVAIIDITNDTGKFIVQDTVSIFNSTDNSLTANVTCFVVEGTTGWTALNNTNPCVFKGGFVRPDGGHYGLTAELFNPGTYLIGLNDVLSATIPEPGTIILLGTGLAALAAGGKKRLKDAKHAV
jgi:hypothetical protein